MILSFKVTTQFKGIYISLNIFLSNMINKLELGIKTKNNCTKV